MPDPFTTGDGRRPGRRRGRPRTTALPLALALALALPACNVAAAATEPPAPTPAPAPAPTTAAPAPAGGAPKAAEPADFKLGVSFYGVRPEPITTAELVVRKGVAYYFASEEPSEVVVFEPTTGHLELIDLKKKLQAEVPLAKLDHKQAVLHRAITYSIRDREASGTRADRVAASMSRALIAPALDEAFDPARQRLRLTNAVATVEAAGEPEPDAARLSLIDATLTALIKLASARNPEAIPPFIRLNALHALTVGHHLRPTELTFVYRLAGPPRKHGWTYRLVPALTEREVEAIRRIILLRERLAHIPFERYEAGRRAKDAP